VACGVQDRVTTAGIALERVSGTAALLLDPLSGGRGPRIRDAVRTVLGADVTAVAYSHAHRDHAGDAAELVRTAREEVAVLAARDCAARLPRLRGRTRPSSGTLSMPPNSDVPPRGPRTRPRPRRRLVARP
jgi:glyoxylase-like metal-dependent hydrolase (beta-lactamase superfamily II)